MPARHKSPSTAVDRALSMLEALADSAQGLTNSELSRRLAIPKSSASYLLRALERRGYVRRDPESGRYRPGLKVLSLNREVLTGLGIRDAAQPILRQLVERIGLTAHLAVLDQDQAVYIEKVDAPGFIKMDTWVGRRMDLHSTSVGKSLIAHRPAAEVESLFRERGLRKRTAKTITSLPRLLKELEKVRAQGYAVDDEENNLGARCVGAPVMGSDRQVQAAVGVSGTTGQVNRETLPRIAELVQEAARKISKQLG